MNKILLKIAAIFLLILSLYACKNNEEAKNVTVEEEVLDTVIPDLMYPDSTLVIATHSDWTKTHYPERIQEFKANPLKINDIIFLGNSITEQGGDWGLKVNNAKTKNRGISGDTTDGVLARLGEINYVKPEKVFLLIGINDLFRDYMTSEMVFTNILKIVNQIHDNSSATKIFVQTILPTNTESLKEKIKKTNLLLKNSEDKEPYEIINLHQEFATKDDLIKMELSTDGVHLNEEGYKVWVKKIINLIH